MLLINSFPDYVDGSWSFVINNTVFSNAEHTDKNGVIRSNHFVSNDIHR